MTLSSAEYCRAIHVAHGGRSTGAWRDFFFGVAFFFSPSFGPFSAVSAVSTVSTMSAFPFFFSLLPFCRRPRRRGTGPTSPLPASATAASGSLMVCVKCAFRAHLFIEVVCDADLRRVAWLAPCNRLRMAGFPRALRPLHSPLPRASVGGRSRGGLMVW